MNEENKAKVAQKEEEKNYFLTVIISLLSGLFVGFIAGILFAPKTGKEIRKDIKDKRKEFVEKSRSKFDEVKGKGKDIIEKSKEKVEALKEVIIPKKEEKKENEENI